MAPAAGEAPRRVTLKQVAARAGVSTMVASYTFANPGRVSERSRRLVRQAAEELGYVPHAAARALRTGRSAQLGVVVPEHLGYAFRDPGASSFLAGVADVCAEHGMSLTLFPTGGALAGSAAVAVAPVDAFVFWTTYEDDPSLAAAIASGRPVAVQGGPAAPGATVVSIDDRDAAAALTTALLGGDGSPTATLGVVSLPTHRSRASYPTTLADLDAELPVTAARLEGIRRAVSRAGLSPAAVPCEVVSVNARADARAAADRLLDRFGKAEALVCLSDELALGAVAALDARGHRARVAGFDGTAEAADRGVVSVAQDLAEQGRLCARVALGLAEPPPPAPWSLAQPRRARTR